MQGKNPNPGSDPAEAVKAWRELNTAADELHDVDTATLTTDPAANPRTLDQRIAATDAISRAVLAEQAEKADDDLASARRRRRSHTQRGERALATAEARADRAAATLEAIDTYEQADNPAASSLELHEADPRIRRMLIGVSLAGSAASALGIAAWAATHWSVPIAGLVGGLAELLLTVPVVLLLTFQGLVRTHNKADLAALGADARRVLTLMLAAIAVLLVVSVGLNVTGIVAGGTGLLGAVGIVGALIALGASAASWGATTVIRSVIRANTAQWKTATWAEDRERLEATASGAFIPDIGEQDPARPTQEPAPVVVDVDLMRQVLTTLADEHVSALADRGTDALQALLNQSGPAPEPAGAARGGNDVDHPLAEEVTTPAEQEERPELAGNRLRVWEAIQQHGVQVSNRQLAELTGLARGTVRTHRTALWRDGYRVFDPTKINDS